MQCFSIIASLNEIPNMPLRSCVGVPPKLYLKAVWLISLSFTQYAVFLGKVLFVKVYRNPIAEGSTLKQEGLSSVESRLLVNTFCCQLVLLCYLFVWNTKRVLYFIMCTENVKIARRDRPRILVSHRCEAFENLLHIDIAPVRRTLSGILHSKN